MLWRATKSLAALVTLTALVAGIPGGLALLGGDPLPALVAFVQHPLAPDDGSLFVAVFTSVGWAAWVSFALGVIVEVPGAFGRGVRAVPGLGAQQAVAAALLAVIATGSTTPTGSSPSVDSRLAPPGTLIVATAPAGPPPPTLVDDKAIRDAPDDIAEHLTHEVQRGEAVLDLAERYYGDHAAYQRLIAANLGVPQPDGRTLHPGQTRIYPGWRLRIPLPVITDVPPAPEASSSTSGMKLTVYQARDEALHAIARTPARQSTIPANAQAATVPDWAHDAPGGTHRVVAGDTLWDVAETKLGDPYRWPEIYKLTRGHPQTNGHALREPDLIRIGWILALPTTAPPSGPASADERPEPEPADPIPIPGTTDPGPLGPAPSPPSPPTTEPSPTTPPDSAPTAEEPTADVHGITLPSQAWISLGLAATISAAAALLRAQSRRRARLAFPIPITNTPTGPPLPASVRVADGAGARFLDCQPADEDTLLPGVLPPIPPVYAPVGMDHNGHEWSLYELPGPVITLSGPGADPAARAILAAALTTGLLEPPMLRPVVVTTTNTLGRLLPPDVPPAGLDPRHETFDGERLIVLADTEQAVTHAEEELVHRRRVLAEFDTATITDLNTRTDHAEQVPPYLLLLDTADHHAARLNAITTHRTDLHLHALILGPHHGATTLHVNLDGTTTEGNHDGEPASETSPRPNRLATLTAVDLADLLTVIAKGAARPEPAPHQPQPAEHPTADTATAGNTEPQDNGLDAGGITVLMPAPQQMPLIGLTVLGPVTLTTDTGPITAGMRSGSYAVLAFLAAHPTGRTLEQISAALHPDTPLIAANKRVRTDITTTRTVLRNATGITTPGCFIVHDPASGRYRLDPEIIDVDLWRMLRAVDRANHAAADAACLAALREATELYGGDFAEGQDRAWITDYATTYRHQLLNVHARIAELLEADHPDQAITALETAIEQDPVNEELYQRIIRIHGRRNRPDAVRRTLRLLENRLAELGGAEPSDTTRRLAQRQLTPDKQQVKDPRAIGGTR